MQILSRLVTRIDTVLAVLPLAALALGGSGVVRAGRWARRRRSAPLARSWHWVSDPTRSPHADGPRLGTSDPT
jgi:hypothetical protein